jgi:Bifunctional DNA primase/polymerase, N-terminal
MSALSAALDFASRGFSVLPATVSKKPLTRHGVYSATTNPDVLRLYDWHFAYCAVATGKINGIDVLDIDLRAQPIHRGPRPGSGPIKGQGVSLSDAEGVNGFETLEALGGGGELPNTLAASSPSGGRHYWFNHIEGSRSKNLGPGLQWFSNKKFVLVPPAPGRAWLNDLPIADAPEWLVKLVLAEPLTLTHTWQGTPSVPPLAAAKTKTNTTSPLTAKELLRMRPADIQKPEQRLVEIVPVGGSIPKALYLQILRLMRKASNQAQRRVIRTLSALINKKQGRNDALHWASRHCFRELMDGGAIEASGAAMLLIEACKANGYFQKDGEEAVRATIISGLGLTEWPEIEEPRNTERRNEQRCP